MGEASLNAVAIFWPQLQDALLVGHPKQWIVLFCLDNVLWPLPLVLILEVCPDVSLASDIDQNPIIPHKDLTIFTRSENEGRRLLWRFESRAD
jgi:hypothetical protein